MLRLVLGAIGAISMVVAAISITNTMVMAIYERTKEIGIMKVIGASLKDIKGLFLTEAAFIGFSGGIIGIIVSYGASFLVGSSLHSGREAPCSRQFPSGLLWAALPFLRR